MKNDTKNLLVVEDDKGLQSQLRWAFDGYEVTIADERTEAINQLRRVQPGVVLLDLGLPPDPGGVTEGLATLQEILSIMPDTKIIIVTGEVHPGGDRPGSSPRGEHSKTEATRRGSIAS